MSLHSFSVGRLRKDAIGTPRIEGLMGSVAPVITRYRLERFGLRRGKDHELDALFHEAAHGLHIYGGFSQPHSLKIAVEAFAEKILCPPDLRQLVTPRGQRHDQVVIDLTDSIAAASEPPEAFAVGLDDALGYFRVPIFKPSEKRRPEIETEVRIIVVDVDDHSFWVKQPRKRVGPVTLVVDAFVPIVIGGRRSLSLDDIEPGVFPRRLVKVSVDNDVTARAPALLTANHRGSRFGTSRFYPPSAA